MGIYRSQKYLNHILYALQMGCETRAQCKYAVAVNHETAPHGKCSNNVAAPQGGWQINSAGMRVSQIGHCLHTSNQRDYVVLLSLRTIQGV